MFYDSISVSRRTPWRLVRRIERAVRLVAGRRRAAYCNATVTVVPYTGDVPRRKNMCSFDNSYTGFPLLEQHLRLQKILTTVVKC